MDNRLLLSSGAGLGAGLMFLLDPTGGRRRRALVVDKASSLAGRTDEAIGRTARDLQNRAQGLVAGARSRFRDEGAVDDDVLAARVRAKLGRYVSHAGAIEVAARSGCVMLGGPVLAFEVDRVLRAVRSVRGVEDVENHLEVHESAEDVPALQGGGERPGERPALFQEEWSPTTRLLAGIAGGGLAVYGARRRGVVGGVLTSVGLGLLLRGLDIEPSVIGRLGDGGVKELVTSALRRVTGPVSTPQPEATSA